MPKFKHVITIPSRLPGGHYKVRLIHDRYEKGDSVIEISGHKPGKMYHPIATFEAGSAERVARAIMKVLEKDSAPV